MKCEIFKIDIGWLDQGKQEINRFLSNLEDSLSPDEDLEPYIISTQQSIYHNQLIITIYMDYREI